MACDAPDGLGVAMVVGSERRVALLTATRPSVSVNSC